MISSKKKKKIDKYFMCEWKEWNLKKKKKLKTWEFELESVNPSHGLGWSRGRSSLMRNTRGKWVLWWAKHYGGMGIHSLWWDRDVRKQLNRCFEDMTKRMDADSTTWIDVTGSRSEILFLLRIHNWMKHVKLWRIISPTYQRISYMRIYVKVF